MAVAAARHKPGARATITQVAERAGVSKSTAGFVLSGRRDQRIAQDTWQRVEAAARELSYRPNLNARTLRTGSSGTVAMITDYVSTTSLANAMVGGALGALREHEQLLFTAETLGDPELEAKVVASLLDRQVDGFIYATMFTRVVSLPLALRGTRVVLLNCTDAKDATLPSVVPDEYRAGVEAAHALVRRGNTAQGVLFVGTLPEGMAGGAAWNEAAPVALDERLAGVRDALSAVGVTITTADTRTDWDAPNGYRAMQDVLETGSRPRAIICVNDAVAVGVYRALEDAEIPIPGHTSVVSFDDSTDAAWLRPGLTSLALPHEQMGREAVRLLLEPATSDNQVRCPLRLIERASVGR